MPRVPRHALTWSPAGGVYELAAAGCRAGCFAPGEAEAWQGWLAEADGFAFHGAAGDLNIFLEARGEKGRYWYAYHSAGGRTRKRYLGATARVTIARLEEVARDLAADGGAASAPAAPDAAVALPATKLAPPQPPPAPVARERLLAALDAARGTPLTLVSAPAGWGKTTVLAAWARRHPRRVAWLALDAADGTPARFWAAAIAALRARLPGVGATALALLHAPQPPPPAVVVTALLNEFAGPGAGAAPLALVLDDYQVIADGAVNESVAFLLDHLPAGLRLVIAGRADPDLPLARLRARGQLAELRAADLRFSEEETRVPGRGARRPARRRRGRGAGGAHRRLGGGRATGGPGPARAGGPGGLAGGVHLDEERRWYRLHDLFHEALLARAEADDPGLLPEAHRRAARWHADHGDAREAIAHALAAGEHAFAADLIAREAPGLWLAGEAGTVLGWLRALPDDTLLRHGRLALDAALRHLESLHATAGAAYAGVQREVEVLLGRIEAGLRAPGNPAPGGAEATLLGRRIRLLRALAASRALLARADAPGIARLAAEVEALAEVEEIRWEAVRVDLLLWLIYSLRHEGPRLIPTLLALKARALAEGEGQAALTATTRLAQVYAAAGRRDRVEQECVGGLALADRLGIQTSSAGYLHLYLAAAYYDRNRPDEAASAVDAALPIARTWQQIDQLIFALWYQVHLALLRGDPAAAGAALREAGAIVRREQSTYHAP